MLRFLVEVAQPLVWLGTAPELHDSSERYELDEVVYRDSTGGLLQVVHDMDELRKTSADEWKDLFGKICDRYPSQGASDHRDKHPW